MSYLEESKAAAAFSAACAPEVYRYASAAVEYFDTAKMFRSMRGETRADYLKAQAKAARAHRKGLAALRRYHQALSALSCALNH